MISFLRINNKIKLGDYLHYNGTIDNIPSNDIIGVCVISSNFLPDGLARFMSIQQSKSIWGRDINIDNKYKKRLPGKKLDERISGVLSSNEHTSLISPYLSDGSFNPDFLIDLPNGNAFQDYKGYENTKKYKKKYGESEELENAFSGYFEISPSYKKSEWYLPSIGELALLFEKKFLINLAIKMGSKGVVLSNSYYWSSSEWDSEYAWDVGMYYGYVGDYIKNSNHYVRAFLAL